MTDVQILSHLKTEASDARSANLSELAPLEFARLMNDFNREAVSAVESALPQIARAIEGIAARLKAGGRLFYLGAGTSGRLGVLDASECPPKTPSACSIAKGGTKSPALRRWPLPPWRKTKWRAVSWKPRRRNFAPSSAPRRGI